MTTTQATEIRRMGEERCAFISIWDGGVELRSRAFFHKDSESVEVLDIHDAEGLETLEEEFIVFADGSTMDVCPSCHEGVLKTTMEPHPDNPMDKTLYEIVRCTVCRNDGR